MTLPAETFPKFMQVIDFIRQGYLPTRACRQAETSWTAMKRAMASHPELAEMFEDALLECRDQMLEILVEIDTKDVRTPYGNTDPKMAAVISKNIMWVLEKMWPEKFVQRLRVESNRSDDVIIAALQTAQMGMAVGMQARPLPIALPFAPPLAAPTRHEDVLDLVAIPAELEGLV